MLAKPEVYKGISYVRISTLPARQKAIFRENSNRERVVKIIKDNSLINDCIIYNDYVEWYNQFIQTLERNEKLAAEQEKTNSLELERK